MATLLVASRDEERRLAAARAQLDRAQAAAERLPEDNSRRQEILDQVQAGRDRIDQ